MNYYISDLHFGHARMNDRIDHRGFKTVEDMDAYMIAQWNSRVKDEDEVFILGDLTISSDGKVVNQLLGRLHGRKTLLVGIMTATLRIRHFGLSCLSRSHRIWKRRMPGAMWCCPIIRSCFTIGSIAGMQRDSRKPICCTVTCITDRMRL